MDIHCGYFSVVRCGRCPSAAAKLSMASLWCHIVIACKLLVGGSNRTFCRIDISLHIWSLVTYLVFEPFLREVDWFEVFVAVVLDSLVSFSSPEFLSVLSSGCVILGRRCAHFQQRGGSFSRRLGILGKFDAGAFCRFYPPIPFF